MGGCILLSSVAAGRPELSVIGCVVIVALVVIIYFVNFITNDIKNNRHKQAAAAKVIVIQDSPNKIEPKAPTPPNPLLAKPEWASHVGTDQYGIYAILTIYDKKQLFRQIPAGTFIMGCDDAESDAAWVNRKRTFTDAPHGSCLSPQHIVKLTSPFWIADTPCTQEFWHEVMGSNPSKFNDDLRKPVEQVSWEDCKNMLSSLNRLRPGLKARFPTEAEWEYSCRAGTTTATYNGDIAYIGARNAPALDAIAWYSGNSGLPGRAMAIDSTGWSEKQYDHKRACTQLPRGKLPNMWGLYDMIGHVWEWCADWLGPIMKITVSDPLGPESGTYRVNRGGSFASIPSFCRSAARSGDKPDSKGLSQGFRICISA